MKLRAYQYQERGESGEEWRIEPLPLERFNLVVGRNATGKTRLLLSLARLAGLVTGEMLKPARLGRWELAFDDGPQIKLGTGDSPETFAPLAAWADRLQYFPFGGRMNLRLPGEGKRIAVAEAVQAGVARHGDSFPGRLLEPLREIGYTLEAIVVAQGPGGTVQLQVQEPHKPSLTPFRKLSQAQQRTLTLLTFLILLAAEDAPATILIDDFCEGLDFERAARLAAFVLERSSAWPFQWIVATNDRYVMNSVPLEQWTILVEDGPVTRVCNHANSRGKFEDFKFTGLSNFDFFSMDFALSDS